MLARLLIVSNRLPVSVEEGKKTWELKPSVGGLATGLSSFHAAGENLWIGWPGTSHESLRNHKRHIQQILEDHRFIPVWLSADEVHAFYYGFSNRTLWPLFHYFPQHAVFEKRFWEGYCNVNEKFAETVSSVATESDILWVHDYHLLLLPALLRKEFPKAKIGFFLHIPFPSYEVFRMLPWREEILQGMLGADLVGFHTYSYVSHFLDCVHALLGHEHVLGEIALGERRVRVDAFPMGIDWKRFSDAAHDPAVAREAARIRRSEDLRVLLSIDRMDYTKGIVERLLAFDEFLSRNPRFKERVILLMLLVPSRTRVEEYRELKKRVDELIGQINGKHGTVAWTPIRYLYRTLPFPNLLSLYQAADVLLVTSLRDGMNLVAKEYVTTKADGRGMLVLSEFAGAALELPEAIQVNPHDITGLAEAIRQALTMPEREKIRRMRAMRERLRRHDVYHWASSFLRVLQEVSEVKVAMLKPKDRHELKTAFHVASARVLFLDYDGTLVPLVSDPQEAMPDEALITLLRDLALLPRTEVVVVSGRSREVLDAWLGDLPLGMVAEHGGWIKEKGGPWISWGVNIDPAWKRRIRPILEEFVERLPGSFVEEKTFTLAWHYRRAHPQVAKTLARELKNVLVELTAHTELQVLEGHKVIEVKAGPFSKGQAIRKWLAKRRWEFILACGDDRTDEDMFRALPKDAWTIKVGRGHTQARFFLTHPRELREVLASLLLP